MSDEGLRELRAEVAELRGRLGARERAVAPRRRRRWAAAAVLAVVLAAVPLTLLANDRFADVPTSSDFHDNINALAGAGVTGGCAPGLYCPDQPVRRDQMAAFLNRGLGRASLNSVGSPLSVQASSGFVPIVRVSITVGGTANADPDARQFVKLDGRADFEHPNGTCPCTYAMYIREVGVAMGVPPASYRRFHHDLYEKSELVNSGVFAAAPGVHNYELMVAIDSPSALPVSNAVLTLSTYDFAGGDIAPGGPAPQYPLLGTP